MLPGSRSHLCTRSPPPDQRVTFPVTYPQKRRFGYARVSTVGQTFDSQLEQLCAAGCTTKIYRETVTGADNDRRELLKMLKALAPGDLVTLTRIDRLARSTFDLFAIVKQIVDAKAQFRSLAEPCTSGIIIMAQWSCTTAGVTTSVNLTRLLGKS
jgi:hypothetical protein